VKHRAFFFAIWYNRGMGNEETMLIEELAKHNGENVFIGARSSFFFIGPADEAINELHVLSAMLKHITSPKARISLDSGEGRKLGRRKVITTYTHEMGDGTVILVEGKEFGAFWTRNEYLGERNKLLKSIS